MVDAFEAVRTRYLVVAWLLFSFYLPGANFLFGSLGLSLDWYSWNLAYVYYSHFAFALVLLGTVYIPRGLPVAAIVGRVPSRPSVVSGLALSAYLFFLAWPAAYILFLPLSYWVPEFVRYWFIEVGEIVYFDNDGFPIVANILSLVSLCVVAPITEEFAFRGVILHRWTRRFGLKTAVLATSLLFAIVHPDPLGAFFFGIGMCVLYLRTQSLILPMICHGAYNLVVWLVELAYKIRLGPEYAYSLERFRDEWRLGLAAFIFVAIWTALYFKRDRVETVWKLPVT